MRRHLTIKEEIYINQFSQDIHTLDEMQKWFESYKISDKRDIMENLFNMMLQSHPTKEDIELSAKKISKQNTSSATMLLNKNKPFNKFGYEICNLPEKELINGFSILLLTLSIADNRRKCAENLEECTHWWHNDLSDPKYLENLMNTQG